MQVNTIILFFQFFSDWLVMAWLAIAYNYTLVKLFRSTEVVWNESWLLTYNISRVLTQHFGDMRDVQTLHISSSLHNMPKSPIWQALNCKFQLYNKRNVNIWKVIKCIGYVCHRIESIHLLEILSYSPPNLRTVFSKLISFTDIHDRINNACQRLQTERYQIHSNI